MELRSAFKEYTVLTEHEMKTFNSEESQKLISEIKRLTNLVRANHLRSIMLERHFKKSSNVINTLQKCNKELAAELISQRITSKIKNNTLGVRRLPLKIINKN